MKTKRCSELKGCNLVLPLYRFQKNGKKLDGSIRYQSKCRDCQNKMRREIQQDIIHRLNEVRAEQTGCGLPIDEYKNKSGREPDFKSCGLPCEQKDLVFTYYHQEDQRKTKSGKPVVIQNMARVGEVQVELLKGCFVCVRCRSKSGIALKNVSRKRKRQEFEPDG